MEKHIQNIKNEVASLGWYLRVNEQGWMFRSFIADIEIHIKEKDIDSVLDGIYITHEAYNTDYEYPPPRNLGELRRHQEIIHNLLVTMRKIAKRYDCKK